MNPPVFTHDWFSGREFQLSLWLARFANKPVHGLEIGCFEGRSTLYFLRDILNHPDSTMTCIDTFQGSVEHDGIDFDGVRKRFLSNVWDYSQKVTIVIGSSTEALPTLSKNYFSFVYVDGSHKAGDVERDATLAWPLLVSGGVMIFDDYLWDGHAGTPDETRIGIDRFIAQTPHIQTPAYQLALTKP